MPPSLDIVIVNWNTGVLLRRCLESIAYAREDQRLLNRVIVVDNGSKDGSVDAVTGLHPSLEIIRNRLNLGFAAACNRGARDSKADYLLFLNPDTRMSDGSLSRAVGFMERGENRTVGIVGIQLVDEQNRIAQTCARFPTPRSVAVRMVGLDTLAPRRFPSYFMTEWDHTSSRAVDHVIGAFFLVRRQMFQALDGFDERFFVYLEDLDFSVRASRAGWTTYYLADVRAHHVGGGTSGQIKGTRLFYALRSRILYGYKHFGRISAAALLVGTLGIEPWARLIRAFARRSRNEAAETLEAYAMLWRYFIGGRWAPR